MQLHSSQALALLIQKDKYSRNSINELIQIGTCFTDKECARIKAGLAESQQTKDKS